MAVDYKMKSQHGQEDRYNLFRKRMLDKKIRDCPVSHLGTYRTASFF